MCMVKVRVGLGKFYHSVKEVKQIVMSEVASSMK